MKKSWGKLVLVVYLELRLPLLFSLRRPQKHLLKLKTTGRRRQSAIAVSAQPKSNVNRVHSWGGPPRARKGFSIRFSSIV
jgi:hypothetical protein